MEEEKKETSIWHTNLNLIFVYTVIFLAGITTLYIMTTILNNKVKEINEEYYTQYSNNM